MFNDSFKERYTTVPIAYYSGNYNGEDRHLVGNEITHNHKEAEIIIVAEGKVRVSINNKPPFVACEGDIIIIAPYEYHCYSRSEGEPLRHSCICFDLTLLYDRELVAALERGELSVVSHVSSSTVFAKRLFDLVRECVEYCRDTPSGWELCAVGGLSTFFGLLMKHGEIKKARGDYKDEFCKSVVEIVAKEYGGELSSRFMARSLGVTTSYFCRKFKSSFGYTFSEYLCMYRVEKSKELLRECDCQISEVALRVGFPSFSYFTKTFRFYMNETPSDYRRRLQS